MHNFSSFETFLTYHMDNIDSEVDELLPTSPAKSHMAPYTATKTRNGSPSFPLISDDENPAEVSKLDSPVKDEKN